MFLLFLRLFTLFWNNQCITGCLLHRFAHDFMVHSSGSPRPEKCKNMEKHSFWPLL